MHVLTLLQQLGRGEGGGERGEGGGERGEGRGGRGVYNVCIGSHVHGETDTVIGKINSHETLNEYNYRANANYVCIHASLLAPPTVLLSPTPHLGPLLQEVVLQLSGFLAAVMEHFIGFLKLLDLIGQMAAFVFNLLDD